MGQFTISRGISFAVLGSCILLNSLFAQGEKTNRSGGNAVIVRVDGQPITQADLDRMYLSRKVDPAIQEKVRDEFIQQLVDATLMRAFLKSKRITVSASELDLKVAQVKVLLPQSATSGTRDLQQYGYTERVLRDELELPLLWRNYLVQTVTDEQLEKFFKSRKSEFDGTEVTAKQIYLKIKNPGDQKSTAAALTRMSEIREEIAQGFPFGEAAKKYSESPSGAKEGDVGTFQFEGKMPRSFSEVAFRLKVGEMSQPFATKFGVHLCLVTQRIPGELSLEDARSGVMQAISEELWNQTLLELKAKTTIQRTR